MLLSLALLAISTSVHCLTEEKSIENSDELFDSELTDNLEYDSLDENEQEVPKKSAYSPPAAPSLPPAYPQPSYQSPMQSYGPSPPPPAYRQSPPSSYGLGSYVPAHHYNPVPLPSYNSSDYGISYLTLEPIIYHIPQQQHYYAPPPPPQPTYESVVPAYQSPSYQPPVYQPAPPANYSTPVANYSTPVYHEQPSYYQQPAVYQTTVYQTAAYQPPAYQPPMANYSAPAINYSTPVYSEQPSYYQQPPTYQPPVYQPAPAANYSTPVANYSTPMYHEQPATYQPPAYQPPAYQPPAYQPPAYQPAPVANYSAPATNYSTPVHSEQSSYQQLPRAHQPAASPVEYEKPAYPQPAPVASNYSSPAPQPAYKQPQPNYTQPAYQKPVVVPPSPIYYPTPAVNHQNYTAPASYQKPHYQSQNYSKPMTQVVPSVYKQPAQQYVPALVQKYMATELAPLFSPAGYISNHWSLYYMSSGQYHNSHRQCPKNPYINGPTYKDVEQAFHYALAQLNQYRQPTYSNASHPSFASRHQIFSLLSQQGARMDEEGLLVEIVSTYLADRICLTKWDKQRYLPQLTKFISTSQFPGTHSCSNYYRNPWHGQSKQCYLSKYRSFDGFCNNPYHPYWGKSNVCHIRLLSPDYADGISMPRAAINPRHPLPNPRAVSNAVHHDVPIDGPYNLMKMQWGQFINHDITNTALSAYEGLVDCCRQPNARGCWPIWVPPGDRFYGPLNVTCLNFIRSGVCPLCQLGPRQQTNKNTAFIDASHVYGNTQEQAMSLRTFKGGQLRTSQNRLGEQLLPIATSQEQCSGSCYGAGDSRVNQHPALTALHVLLLRNHNLHASKLAQRHPDWNDDLLYQEARRINIAEYQMITYAEYFPIVFGPILSAYYHLTPQQSGYTQYNYQVDPTTWNEYSTATCRFGHSQVKATFGLYAQIMSYGHKQANLPSFRLKDWYMRPSLIQDGQLKPLVNGLLSVPSSSVDPWLSDDVRNHLYQAHNERSGGDLAATNIWRGRDHGLPGYVHYVQYCFNYKIRSWKDLELFIPPTALNQLRSVYHVVENIDLFAGGMAERHYPGADIGPTFACVNGIQYNHLKFGDRYYFEHGGQAGSFTPPQLDEIRRSSLARLLCRTAHLPAVPQFAFMAPSMYNPLVNCSQLGDFNYSSF